MRGGTVCDTMRSSTGQRDPTDSRIDQKAERQGHMRKGIIALIVAEQDQMCEGLQALLMATHRVALIILAHDRASMMSVVAEHHPALVWLSALDISCGRIGLCDLGAVCRHPAPASRVGAGSLPGAGRPLRLRLRALERAGPGQPGAPQLGLGAGRGADLRRIRGEECDVAMHIAAVLHGPAMTLQFPPHY